jgi:hypothetical protein
VLSVRLCLPLNAIVTPQIGVAVVSHPNPMTKLTIQVRTADNLLNLLKANKSGNWVVAQGKEQQRRLDRVLAKPNILQISHDTMNDE